MMETGSFADLSLGILESAVLAGEEALRAQNLLVEDDLETDDQETDEMYVYEGEANNVDEFLIESSPSTARTIV